jgi:diguanylate cyclase (GGDEF)-like protein
MADNVLRDALTGAHSRATLQERLREEVERARRYDLPLTLLVADLDHFKSINDAFGHTRGDLVLIGFVERLRGLIRDSDLLFRYGGDEFVLLLLHTDRPQARVLAGRLLDGVRASPFPGNPPLSITLSIGSASFPDDGQSPEDLFECADRRLYEAKRHGRDRVVLEDPLTPVPMTFEAGSRVMERELPLSTLRQFFDQLPARQHGALSISGPFGSGKTWFLAEAVKMARLRGYAAWALEGRAALRTRVYGALAEAKAATRWSCCGGCFSQPIFQSPASFTRWTPPAPINPLCSRRPCKCRWSCGR